MADFDDPDDWRFTEVLNEAPYARIGLEHQPQIAYEIAVFVGAFAIVELTAWRLLSASCRMSQGNAEAILMPLRTYSSRLDRIAAEIKNVGSAENHAGMLEDLRKLNSVRNNYVHAQYGFRPDQQALLRVSWLPSTRQTEDAVITLDTVRTDVREAKRLVVGLFDLAVPPFNAF